MSQPRMLTVNRNEILARADELDTPIANPPSDPVKAACGLETAVTGAKQIKLSADNLRTRLAVGAQERHRIAEFMRSAAKAYEDVDEQAAVALRNGGNGSVSPAALAANPAADPPALADTETVSSTLLPDFIDLKAAANKIHNKGDQGKSLLHFADEWTKYAQTIRDSFSRFREFEDWDGDAAETVQDALLQHWDWLSGMAELSIKIAKQASDLAQVQHSAVQKHPTLHDVVVLEREICVAYDATKYDITGTALATLLILKSKYTKKHETSAEVLSDYSEKSTIDPLHPTTPPHAPTPTDPQPHGDIPVIPGGGLPSTPTMPTMPTLPTMPFTGSPGGDDMGTAADALRRASRVAPGTGVKPASTGGGVGGGALAPPPANGIDARSVPTGAAGSAGSLGRGNVPRGPLMGGGMPMGAPGQGQGNAKTKSSQQEQEVLYAENRAWTEGLIGISPLEDSKEQ
ncbi:PPE domain-containing protein [Mycobacterium marinum]|uniref:PPE domain-containing protein n=2 Tax=Mycobacterium marinum TaxID=1781 RepID=UPI00045FC26A|nr:PPE domain-containing protein [Mycobacterium marinum]AXN51716.1 ESX-1 secretion-associated protein EspB [Mycobacterium marinum]RFZ17206.1 ESX-1 secretion-associated protein EspB [Mycobacterium marinum]RFZ23534.1 ESX-1 secretion-associated protein EspB [Mycobacterium marinum]RFZ24168.1 ESX-1 secretion-associated protein EspB [Mycobacterium marinum]WCS17333.1 PPE domain-containing protein [Mycobacterium marinum]